MGIVKKGIALYEKVVKRRGQIIDKRATDEALAQVVPDPEDRGVFRDIMSQVAKKQSASMSEEQRQERAKRAAKKRWDKRGRPKKS